MIYFFSAPWCPQCKMMKPTIEELIKEGHDIKILNAEKEIELADKYCVMSLPTMVKDTESGITTIHGMKTKEQILDFIK